MLILGLVMKVCGFVVMSAIAFSSGAASRLMAQYPLWLVVQNKFAGTIMIVLGVKLLFDLGSEAQLARKR